MELQNREVKTPHRRFVLPHFNSFSETWAFKELLANLASNVKSFEEFNYLFFS